MKISLLKAATNPNPEADRHIHNFTYSFYPHRGDFRTGKTVREGYLLNIPLIADVVDEQDGTLAEEYSLIYCEQENIVIETIKKAENDNGIIVRLYDAYNQRGKANIVVGFEFEKGFLCTMMEDAIEELDCVLNGILSESS